MRGGPRQGLALKRGSSGGPWILRGEKRCCQRHSELGHPGAEAYVKALSGAEKGRGVEGESLHPTGREEMVSAAMSKLGHLCAEAHAQALALTEGVESELLDLAGLKEIASAATGQLGLPAVAAERGLDWGSLSFSAQDVKHEFYSDRNLRGHATTRTEATEVCARKNCTV